MIRSKDRNKEPGAVVYVVSLKGVRKKCKVGVSADVAKRVKQLATGSPFEIVLSYVMDVYSMELAYRAEKKIHESLKQYRGNGEWFNLAPYEAATVANDVVEEVLKPTRPKHTTFKVPTNGIAPRTLDEMAALNAERRKNKAA
jgi:predicted GIY-YIG superfamily endonuclease